MSRLSYSKASYAIFTDCSEFSNFDDTVSGRGEQNGDLNEVQIY
jgi:hypothetical protein